MKSSSRPARKTRGDYIAFRSITTRWMDNDIYGHVNNAVYYSFLDTAVSGWLLEKGLVVPGKTEIVGFAVQSSCDYFEAIAFPDVIETGLKVAQIGRSSVRYEVGIFRNELHQAAAQGEFTHVYVDFLARRPVEIPAPMREALMHLLLRA